VLEVMIGKALMKENGKAASATKGILLLQQLSCFGSKKWCR